MIDDARWQYQQSVDNSYDDWHPPLMAWTWRRMMLFVQPGPAPMFALQLLLYWGGITLIALWAYRSRRPGLGVGLACVGWLPAPLALMGTVVKDCLMDGLLTCGAGLMLWRDLARSLMVRTSLSAAAFAMIVLAASLRFNAFLACVPLALALAPRRWTSTTPRLVLTGLFAALALLAVPPMIARLVDAEKTDVGLSLIIFDLGGMTEHSQVNLFPEMQVANPVMVNHRCYDPFEWDSYSDWAKRPCPLGFDKFQPTVEDQELNPTGLWLRAIATHPLAYAQHRLTHFNLSTWFWVPSGPDFTAWTQSVPNPWGFHVRQNPVLGFLNSLADAASDTPLGWPIAWISVALAALIVAIATRLRPEIQALAASTFVYGLGYLVFGVATGVRYYVWTGSCAGFAVVLTIAELFRLRIRVPTPAIVGAGAVATIPILMAAIARLR